MAGCAHGPIFSPARKDWTAEYVCRPCLDAGKGWLRMGGLRYQIHLWLRHGNVEFTSCPSCNGGGEGQ